MGSLSHLMETLWPSPRKPPTGPSNPGHEVPAGPLMRGEGATFSFQRGSSRQAEGSAADCAPSVRGAQGSSSPVHGPAGKRRKTPDVYHRSCAEAHRAKHQV